MDTPVKSDIQRRLHVSAHQGYSVVNCPLCAKSDNRFIRDDIDVDFAEAHKLLTEMGISDIAARNHLYSAKYRKYVEKTHLVRDDSVIWVKIVYLSQNDTFWLYAQKMNMSV